MWYNLYFWNWSFAKIRPFEYKSCLRFSLLTHSVVAEHHCQIGRHMFLTKHPSSPDASTSTYVRYVNPSSSPDGLKIIIIMSHKFGKQQFSHTWLLHVHQTLSIKSELKGNSVLIYVSVSPLAFRTLKEEQLRRKHKIFMFALWSGPHLEDVICLYMIISNYKNIFTNSLKE